MITIDTNVLARSILNDDEKQSPLSKAKIKELINNEGVFISSYSIIELVWIMRMKKKSKPDIILTLKKLLETKGIFIGNDGLVRRALSLFEKGKADFCDFMIFCESQAENIDTVVTFDKDFSKDMGKFVELLK